MGVFTKAVTKRIIDAFEGTYFSTSGFEIEFPDSGDCYMNASHRDNPGYQLRVLNGHKHGNTTFKVEFTPGTTFQVATYYRSHINQVVEDIATWANNIKDEMRAFNPLYDEIDELKRKFAEKLDESVLNGTEQFSSEEIEILKSKFEELNAKFRELEEKNEVAAEEIVKVQSTLAELLEDAETFPKKAWYRTAGSKLITLAGKVLVSTQGQKLLNYGTEKLIEIAEK